MAKTTFATKVKSIVHNASELSEAWVGTPIADKLDMEMEALLRGVENNEFIKVNDILLPQLLSTVDFAHNQLEHQEV